MGGILYASSRGITQEVIPLFIVEINGKKYNKLVI